MKCISIFLCIFSRFYCSSDELQYETNVALLIQKFEGLNEAVKKETSTEHEPINRFVSKPINSFSLSYDASVYITEDGNTVQKIGMSSSEGFDMAERLLIPKTDEEPYKDILSISQSNKTHSSSVSEQGISKPCTFPQELCITNDSSSGSISGYKLADETDEEPGDTTPITDDVFVEGEAGFTESTSFCYFSRIPLVSKIDEETGVDEETEVDSETEGGQEYQETEVDSETEGGQEYQETEVDGETEGNEATDGFWV
ncbi:hypothetical protein CWI38_0161p0010 [Hamiltosporidium tvaerminnensis]|uniref:Uncharacterized protein n=1 Tax=Hamiltosporidium tvaerminnensis TaxID=1176355 RepID=A0A4Q9M043_9MICR|nr:hypothetical protein CWI38_0161p0010 [Hamiltosporidium tvaerminnensis]